MPSERTFRQYYDEELLPALRQFEARRKGIVKRFLAIVLVAVGVAGAAGIVTLTAHTSRVFFMIAAAVGAGAVILAWILLTKGFVLDFKHAVIARIVTFCDESLVYRPKAHISEAVFRGSRIFEHRIDRYRGEDHVSGKVGATAIEFSEVHAEYKTRHRDSKGRTHTQWHTIFKGLFFIGDFNKHFKGCTVVLPDMAERTFGWLGKKLQEWNVARSGQLVKLEDPEFEKLFVVYGDDQIEARYILSPSLMRRITDFRNKTGKPIALSFVGSNVNLAVTTGKDMLEPRIFRPLTDFGMAAEFLADVQLAIGIVEELNLNTRIWTKT